MSKTVTSGGVTFMDLTDNRKLEAYITSNMPITQIYNQNTQTYTPDWSSTNLQLSVDVFLDSKEVTTDTNTSIIWYKKIGTQSKTQVGTSANLTINSNQLTGNNTIITYICEAIYNDSATNPPTAHTEIVFTRVDTGIDGSKGQDGTGVTILGSYNTLTELQTARPTGNVGDAYIVDGDLYVWAVDDAQWTNVGNIQGPAGKDGKDAKSIILTGDSQVFKVSKSGVVTPSTIKVTAQTFNTTATNWAYSVNGGQTFLSNAPNGVSRNGNIVTIAGSTIEQNSIVIKASDGEIEDVFTVYKSFDGSDGSKGDDGIPAPIAFLTNENVTFSANAQGQIAGTTIISNVVAYNGATKVTPTIGTISGIPNGMTITPSTIDATNEVMLTVTIANNSTLGSVSSNMGVISIPIISPVSTILYLTWSKVNTGASSVILEIYAPNGYLLSNSLESLSLQAFAYDGSTAITSATYIWSYQENDTWVDIPRGTTNSLTLTKDDVMKSKTYRCAMTYNDATYYATATVQDKTDIYDVMICVSDNINPLTGVYYWVVYALLYSEQGEADPLLGPISTIAPSLPSSGDYWYAVDMEAATVTLKKYNGAIWETSTDIQEYMYDWRQIINGNEQQSIGNTDKVKVIPCNSFTSESTFQCIVTESDGSKLARCAIHLTDTSDPIVSPTAPTGVKDGQIWMQTQSDGTFLLYMWSTDTSIWKQLNADTKNVVHTTKPSSYKTGDLWVVENNDVIAGYTKGSLLQSSATATTFSAEHWSSSLKYDDEIKSLKESLSIYSQYMTVDKNGLHMQAKDSSGNLSPFEALFTNTKLAFYQGEAEVAYISEHKLNIPQANINTLEVNNIQLQKFEWAIEDNGSMSLIVNY